MPPLPRTSQPPNYKNISLLYELLSFSNRNHSEVGYLLWCLMAEYEQVEGPLKGSGLLGVAASLNKDPLLGLR